MKKFVSVLVLFCLMFGTVGYGEGSNDLSTMSDSDIVTAYNLIMRELGGRGFIPMDEGERIERNSKYSDATVITTYAMVVLEGLSRGLFVMSTDYEHSEGKHANFVLTEPEATESPKQTSEGEIPYYAGNYYVGKNINAGTYIVRLYDDGNGYMCSYIYDDSEALSNRNTRETIYGTADKPYTMYLEDGNVLSIYVEADVQNVTLEKIG